MLKYTVTPKQSFVGKRLKYFYRLCLNGHCPENWRERPAVSLTATELNTLFNQEWRLPYQLTGLRLS